jgi:hypothetical protein
VCALLGREATGSRVTWGFDAFEGDVVERFLGSVTQQLQPCVLKFRLVNDIGQSTPVELIGLPLLSRDGEHLQVLVGAFDFADLGPRRSNKLAAIQLISARNIWTEHLPGDNVVGNRAGTSPAKPQLQVIPGGKP